MLAIMYMLRFHSREQEALIELPNPLIDTEMSIFGVHAVSPEPLKGMTRVPETQQNRLPY